MASIRNVSLIDGDVSMSRINVDINPHFNFSAEMGVYTKVREGASPYYTGKTEVTPSEETQTLATADMTVRQNITINPIPSNYGRIAWNGSTLRVF